ncbi:kinesin light chain [Trichonephila clavipes]|nr:kinesin light chain [Trichonephila clavipes]
MITVTEPPIAFTLNNLSAFYGKTGKVEEAEKFCRKAVEFRKRVLGNNHADVGKQLCNLAAICCHTKQYNEALECYKEAIDIFSRTIGPENSYTMKTKNNLASLYVETEHYKEAEKLYKEILSAMPKESEVKTDDVTSFPEKIDRNAIKDHDSVSDNQKQGNISTKSVVPARISNQSSRHCWRSPLPHTLTLIQRDFGCVLGVQQTKQLPHVAKVDLVSQLGL